MEGINLRFKELRKTCKKTQIDFGKVLCISSSGISAIETGQRSVTKKHLIMLSKWDEYNVNIDWLRTGKGDMFLPNKTDALELIRKQYNLTDARFRFIANFLRLSKNDRDVIINFLESVFRENATVENKVDPAEPEKNSPPVEPDGETKTG